MTFEGPGDELNVEEQVNTLDAVIAENPSVLCFSASDMNSCQAQLETATENDIPVIIFDSNVSENELVTGFYGTDNERVGEIAGEKIAEALGEKGSILIFSAQEKTESSQKRVSGFKTAIAEYTDMEVVQEVYADQVEDMSAAMQEALAQNPDTAGVYCTNADVSELYLALDQTEEDLPVMIGVDATTKQQQAVKDGREYGIVSQDPYEMGYQTILAAAKVTDPENREAEGTVFLEPAWIDASNLEDPEYSSYLKEIKKNMTTRVYSRIYAGCFLYGFSLFKTSAHCAGVLNYNPPDLCGASLYIKITFPHCNRGVHPLLRKKR